MPRNSVGFEIVGSELATHEDHGSVWFELDQAPGVRVVLTVLLDGTVRGFEVHSVDDVPVGRRLVRNIPLGEMARTARARLRDLADRSARGLDRVERESAPGWQLSTDAANQALALRGDERRPGRRGRPDAYYAELAMAYEAWQDTDDRLEALAARVHLSTSGLRAALNTARAKGLLTKAPPGRAGGAATAKARRLVDGIDR